MDGEFVEMKYMLIIFNFGIIDDVEIYILNNGNIIRYIKDKNKNLESYLKQLEEYKKDSYCMLPKDAFLKNLSGNSIAEILINFGFKVA